MDTLGRRIRAARTAARLTQEMLGERVGVSNVSVSDWETDKSPPELRNLIKAAVELGVRFEWLATGRGEMAYTGVREEAPDYGGRDPLPSEVREVLALWQRLPSEQKSAIAVLMRTLVNPTLEETRHMRTGSKT